MEEKIILSQEIINVIQEDTMISSNDVDRNKKLFRGNPFCVTIDPADTYLEGFIPYPYFKLYNTNSVQHRSCVVRFALREAKIIYHHDGHRAYKINTRLLRDIKRMLEYECNADPETKTVLDVMNKYLKRLADSKRMKYTKITAIPDYTTAIGQYQPNKYGVDGELC